MNIFFFVIRIFLRVLILAFFLHIHVLYTFWKLAKISKTICQSLLKKVLKCDFDYKSFVNITKI